MKLTMRNSIAILLLIYSMVVSGQLDSVKYYTGKAQSYEYNSFDSMMYYADKLKQYAQKTDRQSVLSNYHSVVAVALQNIANYDSALYHGQQALVIGHRFSDSLQIARANQNLGVVHKFLGNPDIAMAYFTDALKIAHLIGDSYISAMSNLTIGQINISLGQNQEASKFLNKTLEIGKLTENQKIVAAAYVELGTVEIGSGNLDQALEYYLLAEENMITNTNKDGESSICNNIGAIYFYKNDLRRAIQYYFKARDKAIEANDPVSVGIGLLNVGEAYIYLGDYNNAENYLFESLETFKKTGNKQFIANNYAYLHELALKQNEYQLALEYFKLKDVYEDSILNESNLAKIADLQVSYDTEKKEQKLKLITAENELKTNELSQTRILIIAVFLLAVLVISVMLLLNSRKRYKLKSAMSEEREELQRNRFKAVVDAEEKERKRIAQELHDGLGQVLSTARITVSALDNSDKKVKNSLNLIDHAVKEVRNISHNMMPNALMNSNVEGALRDLVDRINDSDQIKATYRQDCDLKLDESVIINVYRVTQEVFNNALKYANATHIELSIAENDSHYQFKIQDNGQGFDKSASLNSGIGLSNIRSRVELMKGDMNILSNLGSGTTVIFSIPK